MITIEYSGLKDWKRRSIFYAIVAILLLLVNPAALRLLYLPVIIGGVGGLLQAWFLSRQRLDRLVWVWWICAATISFAFFLISKFWFVHGVKVTGWLGLGSACVAVMESVFGLAGAKAMECLRRKHAGTIRYYENEELKNEPKPQIEMIEALDRISMVLPAELGSKFRTQIQNLILAEPDEAGTVLQNRNSGLGGIPDLPPDVAWPTRDGKPLDFLGQINLAELPASDVQIPRKGLLSFFYNVTEQPWGMDDNDGGFHKILFTPDAEVSVPMPHPSDCPFREPRQVIGFRNIRAYSKSSEINDSYYQFYHSSDFETKRTLRPLLEVLHDSVPHGHRVISSPNLVQNDMESDLVVAARIRGLPPKTKWTMLFQIESVPEFDWHWGDDGSIYFLVPTADIAKGNFERSWVILQSP